MAIIRFNYRPPNFDVADWPGLRLAMRAIWNAIISIKSGKLECVTELTLTANAGTTVLNFYGLSPQSAVFFDPKTANAATEKAAGTMFVLASNRQKNVWTVTHANNAQADRQFQVVIIG